MIEDESGSKYNTRRLFKVNNVCAIIVTYNPNQDLIVNVEMLLPQVNQLVIIDNASNSKNQVYLDKIKVQQKVTVIYNDDNLGIASALNQGVGFALEIGSEWIATFDQDSMTEPGYIELMLSKLESCPGNIDKIALLTPTIIEMGDQDRFQHTKNDDLCRVIKSAITSGALVRAEVFSKVGYFRADYFIDYVDYEFCFRLRRFGYTIIQLGGVHLLHHLGKTKNHKLFNNSYTATHHSPLRRYTIARNRIITYKLYVRQEPVWVAYDAISWIKEIVKILFWEDEKRLKLLRNFQGIWDGLYGRPVRRYLFK